MSDIPKFFAGRPLSRRRLVKTGAAAAIAVTFTPVAAFAQSASDAATGATADFAKLSQFLTGKPALDPTLAQALLQALLQRDSALPQKLRQLDQFIQQTGAAPDTLQAGLHDQADLAALPGQILQAWYLGIVGSGEDAVCVTYADALANKAVADVLVPPSYAYGAYGSWKVQPV